MVSISHPNLTSTVFAFFNEHLLYYSATEALGIPLLYGFGSYTAYLINAWP